MVPELPLYIESLGLVCFRVAAAQEGIEVSIQTGQSLQLSPMFLLIALMAAKADFIEERMNEAVLMLLMGADQFPDVCPLGMKVRNGGTIRPVDRSGQERKAAHQIANSFVNVYVNIYMPGTHH